MPASSAPDSTLSRAAVVRGLAWSAPVVAAVATAPVSAASPWVRHAVTFVRQSTTAARGTGAAPTEPTAPTDTIAVSSTLTAGRRHLDANLTTSGQRSTLTLASAGTAGTAVQVVTLTFPTPVRDLRFVLGDIDMNQNEGSKGFADVVTVSPEPQVIARSGATGAATATSPLTAAVEGVAGHATVVIPGPVSVVRIGLSNGSGKNGSGEQSITLSEVSYLGDLRQY